MSSRGKVLDWFKPLRSEALARLRINTIGLVSLTVLANLLPVPSPWRALDVVWGQSVGNGPYYYVCAAELLMFSVLALNVLQAAYALQYPRAPLPPPPSPAKHPKNTPLSPATRQWRLQGPTPTSTPQRQKAFSTYAPSPVSTPSRTLNYTFRPTSSQPDASFVSSVSSVPGSPASPLAAYRGRHSASVGRAFDGSLLSQLAKDESDDEES
ncbi:hypothetical protein LXA43DRAFT_1018289 [Ganoderma leucocontextum]|nr:hypothetical protein LXA43DRAFT_1018289 [Ganoderma leucocontextum]